MLEPVEVLPGARRALRRAVELECEVMSELWDEPVPHVATDLSPFGIRLETPFPLEVGTSVVLSFTPPRWRADRDLVISGNVRRVDLARRRADPKRSGMGIAFCDLDERTIDELRATLRGIPPPLPRRPAARRIRREILWVDRADEPFEA